jgi:hypothetical protein
MDMCFYIYEGIPIDFGNKYNAIFKFEIILKIFVDKIVNGCYYSSCRKRDKIFKKIKLKINKIRVDKTK